MVGFSVIGNWAPLFERKWWGTFCVITTKKYMLNVGYKLSKHWYAFIHFSCLFVVAAGRSNVSNDSGFVSGSNASNSFNSSNSFNGNNARPNNNHRDNSRQFRSPDAIVRSQQSTMVRPNGARPGIMPSNNNRGGIHNWLNTVHHLLELKRI